MSTQQRYFLTLGPEKGGGGEQFVEEGFVRGEPPQVLILIS